jgi:hypothetical protein
MSEHLRVEERAVAAVVDSLIVRGCGRVCELPFIASVWLGDEYPEVHSPYYPLQSNMPHLPNYQSKIPCIDAGISYERLHYATGCD